MSKSRLVRCDRSSMGGAPWSRVLNVGGWFMVALFASPAPRKEQASTGYIKSDLLKLNNREA
jgi:hypothetical protein